MDKQHVPTEDYTLEHEWEKYATYPQVALSPFSSYLYENDMISFFIKLARYKFASRVVGSSSTVIDLGCGDGMGSLFLSQYSKKTIGVDIHEPAIDFCRDNYSRPNLEFVCSAGEDLQIQEPVDAVVCLDTIEHVPEEIAPRLISKISQTIVPSGVLVLGTPNVNSQPYASENRLRQHYIEYGREELEQLVAPFFRRSMFFSMNDEMVHTGFHKMAWYSLLICSSPVLPKS